MTEDRLEGPLSALSGVGPRRLAQLNRLGLFSVGDLLAYFPRDYEDRRSFRPVAQLQEGEAVCVRAMLTEPPVSSRLPGGKAMIRARAADETGVLFLTFFNQPYLHLETGQDYIFFGRPERVGRTFGMVNPSYERFGAQRLAGRLLPVYPHPGELSQNQLRRWIAEALEQASGHFLEPLPRSLLEQYRLCSPEQAFSGIHFPAAPEDVRQARRRLIFEELFTFCLAGQRLKREASRAPGAALTRFDPEEFFRSLPYAPTGAQCRATAQCFDDLCSGRRMNRLLQGDVGSGKTLVAAACAWLACQSGRQAVIMAPTELLARQHEQTFRQLLSPFGIPVELLCGSTSAPERRRILSLAQEGGPLVLCGTHALIQSGIFLPHAALTVVDEQHRFGVRQRAALGQRSAGAHLLAMSATPIPRTLTLILYGDLDVSILDQLPPGRQPIRTFALPEDRRQDLYGFLQRQAAEGGQAYIVCPLIEEKDGAPQQEKQAAAAYLDRLRQQLPGLRAGLLHGRMKAGEKDAVMEAFLQRELDVLVCTTVVEVGVNVPNATLMIVENAGLFGLSQLHQLRGRVGRGSRQSYCFLMCGDSGETARQRLSVLCRTNDGFQIAEEDLRLRGPGDFFGSRQHGLPVFQIADLAADLHILEAARQSAETLLARDPELSGYPLLARRVQAAADKTLADSMN